jgi:hypothetical protein
VDEGWVPQVRWDSPVFIGTDYGRTKDTTGVTAVTWGADGRLWVLNVWHADPAETEGGEILVQAVEELLGLVAEAYAVRAVYVDPWQLASLSQRLRSRLPIREVPWTTATQERAAGLLFRLLASKRLRLFPDSSLVDELAGLQLVVTPRGFRFQNRSRLHDDRAVSLALAALAASEHGQPSGRALPILLGGMRPTARLAADPTMPHDRRGGVAWLEAGLPTRDRWDAIQDDPAVGGAGR